MMVGFESEHLLGNMNNNKKTGIIGIIITVIILIIIVSITNVKIENWAYFGNTLENFVMPVQNGLVYLKNKIAGNDNYFINIEELKTENESLKEKNTELEQSLRELEIIKAENATLKEYVNLKDKYAEYATIPANVIQRDFSNYSKIIVINVGKDDGIDVNMTVISEKGLVGHVISVTDNTAKVQTIIDTSNAVSGSVSTTRDSILLKGTLEETFLKATAIPTDSTIIEGDYIETSGLGGIYPKGIFIGTVKKVVSTKNITDRYAYVEPAVDFSKLETVLVITD